MAKKNWTDNATIGNDASDPYRGGGTSSDNKGDVKTPVHLKGDSQLESYISETQSEYDKDYDSSWGPKFHNLGSKPSSKGGAGMD